MALGDIAADLEVTAEQRARGVATVDATADLSERLEPVASELPCSPREAAAAVEAYADGASVGAAGEAAGLPPITAAKALYRLGVEGVCPLSPTGRRIVADWIAGDLPRAEARELTGASEAAFLLTAYVETHEPLPAGREAVEPVLGPGGAPGLGGDGALSGSLPDPEEFY